MAVEKINLGVLISGRGSNLQALIDACEKPDFPAKITVVISNISEATGLERAMKANIPAKIVSHLYPNKEAFESELHKALKDHGVELVCLAGFMRILTERFINLWPGRLINIHPSLLPDYKGLHTHERVLEDGQKETGCTVHYVVPETDSGPVIVQRRVPVKTGDTAEMLGARVLAQEHIAYPEAVKIVAQKLASR